MSKITPTPVEPDEFLVNATSQDTTPVVIPALRLLSGHNLKTTDKNNVGTLGSVGG